MPTTVNPDDVRNAAYGLLVPDGFEIDLSINRLIEKAYDRITHALPMLEEWVLQDKVPGARVDGVVEDMVVRVLRNPNGLRQYSIDDFSKMVDTALSSGGLYLSDAERLLLAPTRSRSRVGSIRLGVPAWRLPRG